MGLLKTECNAVCVKTLTDLDIQQMYQLFEHYYECISFETFQTDLSKKDKVILMREKVSKKIRGFSTVKKMTFEVNKNGRVKRVQGFFSGDTIVAREYWGQKAINGVFAKLLIKEKLKNPFTDFYWFLISKGYKTYLLLTNNFTDYYPRFDRPNLPHIQEVLDSYATALYPEAYDQKSGVLRFETSMGQLKSNVAPINAELLGTHPNISFFQRKNPHWQKGDELVCLGVVNWSLFGKYFLKSVGLLPKQVPAGTAKTVEARAKIS